MKEIDKIIAKLREIKPFLAQEYNVTEIGIFGSYARGEQTETSDIDILIEYDRSKKMSLFKFIGLEDFLKSVFNKKVDLVTRKALKPRMGKRILNEVIFV
jgi:uncharacterized protein